MATPSRPATKKSAAKRTKKAHVEPSSKHVATKVKHVVTKAKRLTERDARAAEAEVHGSAEKRAAVKVAKTSATPKRTKAPRASGRAASARAAHRALVEHALSYPEAVQDFPWGELVVKVKKKVFVFFGHPSDTELGLSAKLPRSGGAALMSPFAKPTGYGLGKSGWVSFTFGEKDEIPVELLRRWIDESYRAVAPKTLVKTLPPTSEEPA